MLSYSENKIYLIYLDNYWWNWYVIRFYLENTLDIYNKKNYNPWNESFGVFFIC